MGLKTVTILTKLGATKANATKYADAVDAAMAKFNINTPRRQAMFLAQIMHESGALSTVVENLNYRADRLLVVFPKYFKTQAQADAYAKQPQKIANRVYANRLGNGDEASGDGWKFRGRGLIQLTGKENYQNLAKAIGKTLDETVEYLKTEEGAVVSAGWFWDSRKLNSIADTGDIVAVSKKVNGGTIGLDERQKYYNKAISVLG